jgi:hypothetical protein
VSLLKQHESEKNCFPTDVSLSNQANKGEDQQYRPYGGSLSAAEHEMVMRLR